MSLDGIDQLARTVLYEGYTLYPYRPSALKNQRRFAFGAIYPRAWAERTLDAALLRAEVVVAGRDARVQPIVRFLRLDRGGGAREIAIDLLPIELHDPRGSRDPHATTLRWDDDGLALDIECTAVRIDEERARVAIEIRNVSRIDLRGAARDDIDAGNASEIDTGGALGRGDDSASRSDANGARRAIDHEAVMDVVPASTHVALRVDEGAFVSAIDPPADAAAQVAACRSSGLYPVLVGERGMLCAPIILPDYPQLADQSPGDFFDGTEIDEMLTLRVLTMTDAEKCEASAADPRIAALIARTEQLGIAETAHLHGVVRTPWPRQGTRVRIRPHAHAANRAATSAADTASDTGRATRSLRGSDAFDVLLAGKSALVASVERDLEGRVMCAVTIDDDPGADLGAMGMPGHRFYFRPDELEVLA